MQRKQIYRKKLIPLLCGIGILSAGIGSVYSYLSSNEFHKNSITIGSTRAEVKEEFQPKEIQKADEVRGEDISTSTQKLVKIKNTGTNPEYVRVKLLFSDSAAENATGLSYDYEKNYHSLKELQQDPPDGWVYINDDTELGGYFYYTEPLDGIVMEAAEEGNGKVLEEGGETTPLLTNINTTMIARDNIRSDEDQIRYDTQDVLTLHGYDLIVYDESVQAKDIYGKDRTGADAWKQAWTDYLSQTGIK